jgi:putative peptidoglycan lipid II flippase
LTLPAAITGQPQQTPVQAVAGGSPRTSLRSVSLVTGLTFGQLLVQFALQMVLARWYGAAAAMDAYVAALALPVVVATIISGPLGYVLVPAVAERLSQEDDVAAARVASQIGLYVLALSLVITGVIAAAAGPIAAALCPGFGEEKLKLTASLLAVLSLLVPLNCLISYLNALFQAYHRFTRPAVAGVVGPLVTVGYVVLLHDRQGIAAVAWGLVAGAAVTAALLLPLFARLAWQSSTCRHAPTIATRRCLALLVPLVLGAVYWRLEPLVDRWLGSYLASGSLAHLGYAWRLVSGLALIGTSGLSTVSFPAISAHAAARRGGELDRELAYAVRFFLFLMVPVCVGVALFAGPVVRLLFEHGRFTPTDTAAVSVLVVLYVGAIGGGGIGDLFARTFYAEQDTRTPVIVSAIVFAMAVGLKVLFVRPWGVAGLAAASSLYYGMNAGVLLTLLVRQRSPAMLAGALKSFVRSLAGSWLACGVAAFVLRWPATWSVLPAAAAGAISYLAFMWLLGDEFAARLLKFLHQRR